MSLEAPVKLLEVTSTSLRFSHSILLGSQCIPYQLVRSKRRSIGFLITDEGLRVTAPNRTSLAEIKSALLSKQRWILTKLHEQQNRPAAPEEVPVIWTTGATLPFLGKSAALKVAYDYASSTRFDNEANLLILNLPSDSAPALCKKHLMAWLMNQARRHFSLRLPYFAGRLNVQYHSFSLSHAKTSWGSCNSQGKIRLNWRLIHLPPPLIDYVITHELAHLHEMNHSPRFWAKVGQVFPNYEAVRNELKVLGLNAMSLL